MSTNPADAAPVSPEVSPDTSAPKSADVVDVEALKAAAAELAALKAKQADEKKADREARKRAQEEAEKAGELAKALDAAKARLAELEGAEPLAQKWRAYEAEEAKRLDAEAAALPEAVRDLYQSASDLDARRKVIAAFRAAGAAAPKAVGTPPAMGAPPSVTAVDVEAAMQDPTGKKLAEIKARDPGAVSAFFGKLLGARDGSTSLGVGRFARPATKAPNA
jgi:hypothetical protein